MKYFVALKNILSDELSTLIYFVTNRCNARCRMCYNHKNLNKNISEELSVAEVKNICNKLQKLLLLQCSGGEPFLKENLFEILSTFARISVAITIPTNATLPQRIEKTISKLVKENKNTVFRVALSLDGLKIFHDKTRDFEGAFDLWMETYLRVKKIREKNKNLLIIANTVLNKSNEHDIFNVIDFVHNLGVDHHTITYMWGNPLQEDLNNSSIGFYKEVLAYQGCKNYHKKNVNFSGEIMRRINQLADNIMVEMLENKKIIYPCKATKKFVVMLPNGDVKPCHFKEEDLGNVRDYSYDIPLILRQDKTNKLANDIYSQKCWCTVQCNNRNNVLYNKKNYLKIAKKALQCQ